jgi:protein-tyrosine phosphatase
MTTLRFGWVQVILGLALALVAALLPWPAPLLAWPALAVTWVGIGYLGWGPSVFGKRRDGTMSALHRLALLPYHVVAFLRLRWDRWRNASPAWHRVNDALYLGGYVASSELPPGTRIVVDVTCEFSGGHHRGTGREYHCIPTLDASAPDYLEVAQLARALASRTEVIYVHCAAGKGRSATFAAALILARGLAEDAAGAEAYLRARRPIVNLHPAQRALLERFANELGSADSQKDDTR